MRSMMNISFYFAIIVCSISIQFNEAHPHCTTTQCGQNGRCVEDNDGATCKCNDGFIGSRCQARDPCAETPKPCGVNGACYPIEQASSVVGQETYKSFCQCYSGFTGDNCQQIRASSCASNPCLNNAQCVNKPDTWDFQCICIGPYQGHTCGNYLDYCAHNQCINEGLCIPDLSNKNYTCDCLNGFEGAFCEREINECEIIVNGETTSPCNKGVCYDLIDNYFCECFGPYSGQNCETLTDPCSSNPCGGGSGCVSNGADYVCSCSPGYFGNPCKPNPCYTNPCSQPGSTCVPVEPGALASIQGCSCSNAEASYVCLCPSTDPVFANQLC